MSKYHYDHICMLLFKVVARYTIEKKMILIQVLSQAGLKIINKGYGKIGSTFYIIKNRERG